MDGTEMLAYFHDKDLVRISEKQPANWEEAVRISCENLIEKGIINQIYVDEVVAAVHKYGPYIVIVPGVAMPHSTDKSAGVFGTAIAFTKFKEKIYFEADNEEKQAKLFFTLAAKNPEEHMTNIAALSDLLMTDGVIEALENMASIADFEALLQLKWT
ncbi:PTS ascorbate transporter subunit IIA [Bacilli bacterium]|nr:PTS ascorbate transporter subunit IIA [Bacilli bacterium]GHU44927.1 PTS ascorbate transporter subunit IIA [Bacilli bacterium]